MRIFTVSCGPTPSSVHSEHREAIAGSHRDVLARAEQLFWARKRWIRQQAASGVFRICECKQRNYNTMKNKKNTPDRLELNKYCPFCRKHTVHNETK